MHDKGTALPTGHGTSKRGRSRKSQIAYTVAEFAELLGKRPDTVYEWIHKGLVPAERIGGTYFIPERALGSLRAPADDDGVPAAAAPGGEAA
jgi:excisionase family DNA binding protein